MFGAFIIASKFIDILNSNDQNRGGFGYTMFKALTNYYKSNNI